MAILPVVVEDAEHVGAVAAELVRNRLLARPDARFGLEAGSAPAPMFAALRAHARAGELPSARATVLALEAHVETAGALRAELTGIALLGLHALDDGREPTQAIVERHAALVEAAPLDLAVVGLDAEGGVALDAPPGSYASGVRVVPQTDGSCALTVGLGTLYRARELVVLAVGDGTAGALQRMLEGPVDPRCPSSLLRDHPRLTVLADRAAAAALTPRPQYTSARVVIVLGHREPGVSSEHHVSFESRARLRRAHRHAARHACRALILTGYTSTAGLSEAEQMKGSWDESVAPALLEVAGRNTAENATRSLPLALALGGVRRVDVVTSVWHLRTGWFFAPYRRYGLSVHYRVVFAHGQWLRMLAHELLGFATARRQRAAAFAELRLPPLRS
jgi:glucosamine-6-phosphate deaminase